MARAKREYPRDDRHTGQRSQKLPSYLTRWIPEWRHPKWMEAEFWRSAVRNQPFAIICRETLISNVLSLDWKIEPRDSTLRDELRSAINYYTKFFEYTGDYNFSQLIEWMGQDYFDIPFGSAAELGYRNDNPTERLLWIELLDGSTLFPTRNRKWPVGQVLKENSTNIIYFPRHSINRLYMSPRVDIMRDGWGMAPPEKIYLTLELLRRGDAYYANLLLDTPEVGILDLGDMEKSSAEEWVSSWRDLLHGIDPFKIPVLYEHTSDAKFISFTRSPIDLMFDKATMKYAALTAAGYGMSLSDIGIQAVTGGGETLAGAIRQERRTRKTGFARTKQAYKYWFDRMLPDELEFRWIDLDDELSTALGRARLASSTAASQLIAQHIFTPDEMRQQIIADGLITISVPEVMADEDRIKLEQQNKDNANERPSLLGRPVAPSSGGHGEVMDSDIISRSLYEMLDYENIYLQTLIEHTKNVILPDLDIQDDLSNLEFNDLSEIWSEIYDEIPELKDANIQLSLPKIYELIDWCEFPINRIRKEWLEIFHDLDSTVSDDEFIHKLDEILINTELSVRSAITDVIAWHLYSLDESNVMQYDIRESLRLVYNTMIEKVADSVVNLMKEIKENG